MRKKAPNDVIERLNKLKKAIEHHRYNYHVLDKEEISEAALDSLKHELTTIESEYPELVTPDSPSQRVGGKALDEFKKVRHTVPQWSFNDAFTPEEIREFDARVKRFLAQAGVHGEVTYTCEHKIDGLKIVLTYEDGLLIRAATRGDGVVGEDVTENVKTIESVPLKLNRDKLPGKKPPRETVVEGEVWLGKSTLERLNKVRERNGEASFANPRNLAAGSIRQLDPKIAAERHLDSFIYDLASITPALGQEIAFPATQREELEFLRGLGFKVNRHYEHCANIEGVVKYWQEWQKKKTKEDYWIDGVVVKVDERKYQETLGYTGKAPRWGIAFKFPAEQVTTVLEDITFQVGRMGTITPVAVLRPVLVAGSVVSRATLHNEDEIKRLDVRIGDTVIIQKAGDVIPDIVAVVREMRTSKEKPFIWPTRVAACGGDGKIERVPGEAAWRCVSKDSYEQVKRRFHYFVSKKCFDIDGLGPKIVDVFLENGLISSFDDIFTLKKGDILNLPRFAEKSADNIIASIEKAKKVTLSRLITSLSIPQVGEETAYDIAKHFTVGSITKATKADFEAIYGVGPIVAESLSAWFGQAENRKLLENILSHVTIVKEDGGSGKLAGKTFVFTGTLPTLDRSEGERLVRSHDGEVSSSVSVKTSFVVAGEAAGSKLDRAVELGVKVITEDEFLKMVK